MLPFVFLSHLPFKTQNSLLSKETYYIITITLNLFLKIVLDPVTSNEALKTECAKFDSLFVSSNSKLIVICNVKNIKT